MKPAGGLVAVLLAVLLAWVGNAAWGGHFLADYSAGHDIYHLSTLYERAAHHVLNGHYPAWMPEFQGGYPVAAAWMYGLFYPPLLLFGLLPAEMAWTWLSVLHVLWAALGVFLLLRRSVDVPAAMTGALVLALSEFALGRILCGHLNLLMPLAWLPWVLLQIRRLADGRRGAAGWLALSFGLGLIAGHVQLWFYLGPLTVAYAAWQVGRSANRRPVMIGAVLGLGAGLAIAAVQWLPTWELYGLAERSAHDVSQSSIPAAALAGKAFPGFFGWRPDSYWGPWFLDHEYLGVGGLVVVFLAGMGLARGSVGRRAFWSVVGALGVLVALGDNAPFGNVMGALPLVSTGREPGRALVLTLVAAAVLSGDGVENWLRAATAERRRILIVASTVTAAVAIAAAVVLRGWLAELPTSVAVDAGLTATGWPAVALGCAWLLALGLALFGATRKVAGAWALPLVVVLHAVSVAIPPAVSIPSAFYHRDRGLAAAPHRVLLLDQRFPPVERQGRRTLRQMCHVDTPWAERFRALDPAVVAAWQDVGLVIGPESPWRPTPDEAREPALVQRRLDPVGGVVFFETARTGVADDEALATLGRGERVLLVAATPDQQARFAPESREAPRVTVTLGGDPNHREVHYRSPRDGWLFLAERFYPGWEAALDGEPIDIHRANVMFQAVWAPAGKHVLVLDYRPVPLRRGAFLSLIGLALAGFLVWTGRDRTPKA